MANYTPTFSKPYPSGWADKPSKTTPVTAAIMNSYDTAIAALESYLRDNAIDTVTVSVEQFPSDGRQWLGTITVGSNQYRIYMPSLRYENSVSDGIMIGAITLGEQSFDVYAPKSSAGGSTVSVVPKTLTGINIAEITVDGTTYQLYAPTSGGGSGSTVTAEATLTDGTEIGKITIDGKEIILYAPQASSITVDSELSATSENAIQNKAVDAAVKNLQQQIDAGGTGGSITVDSTLSTTSENPVQNKVVTAELNKKIETLDDESQAPDVVNFDLDSELSLTSVKGVQNKAIAEEFQNYANGTKVAAKAKEAETAKTAASATTAQSATTAESATKATRDAQGNVIDTTYAKKTEIPQGAVVDDALSASSTNPVQNKVVKAEFDKINSNLTDLKMLGWSVPKECPVQNEANSNQFVQKVGRVDLGSQAWTSVSTNTSLYSTSIKDIKTLSNNIFLLGYSVTSYDIETSKMTNKNIKMSGLDKQDFYIKNDSYTDLDSFKKAMQGQYLYYELATPITRTIDGNEAISQLNSDLSNIKDGTTPSAKALADEDGNNIKSTYATKSELPSAPSSLYETVNVDIITDLFEKSQKQHYVNCERVGNICTLSFYLQATATVDYRNRHELFDIDKIPKNNLTIGFCVVNFNGSVSNTANSAYNYINSISVQEDYSATLKRNTSKVYLLPYRTGGNILSNGYEIIGQISWAVEV